MIVIKYNGIPIGEQTVHGKMLDKAAFYQLKKTDRIRAYLLMVYPGVRSASVIKRVCRMPGNDAGSAAESRVWPRRGSGGGGS